MYLTNDVPKKSIQYSIFSKLKGFNINNYHTSYLIFALTEKHLFFMSTCIEVNDHWYNCVICIMFIIESDFL